MPNVYKKDSLSALDAITEAQRIAFAPMLFQTALCLRNSGILDYLDKQGKLGATLEAICTDCDVNEAHDRMAEALDWAHNLIAEIRASEDTVSPRMPMIVMLAMPRPG